MIDCMRPRHRAALVCCGLAGLLFSASAQTPPPSRPDPLDPHAAVPAATHRSALARYRAASEPQIGDWKEANRNVNRIGGWRAYAREAHAPASAASAAHKH